MGFIVRRFAKFRRNGMRGWASGRPLPMKAALFLPCLAEYLVFSLASVAGLMLVVILMAALAILRLDREPQERWR